MNTGKTTRNRIMQTGTSLALAVLFVAACRSEGADWGRIFRKVKKAVETGQKIKKAYEVTNLTPLQEHYIGRAVAAKILAAYRPYDNPRANRYLNLLGQTLAQASDRPDTFMGYRFLILDSDEINSFAAPGGFIFITRGLIRCCESEDGLAAVLAHEISHVQWKHGLRSIRTKRLTAVGAILLGEATAKTGSGNFKQLTRAFNGSIDDIAGKLISSKYSRATEVLADQTAVEIMRRVGYSPSAFVRVLTIMQERFKADRRGFYRTHPAPAYRIRVVRKAMGGRQPAAPALKRTTRFRQNMAGV